MDTFIARSSKIDNAAEAASKISDGKHVVEYKPSGEHHGSLGQCQHTAYNPDVGVIFFSFVPLSVIWRRESPVGPAGKPTNKLSGERSSGKPNASDNF